MFTLIIYFLCVYIIFKGIEIFQIALMSNREDRTLGLIIGCVAILGAIGTAGFFGYIALSSDLNMMEALPRL